MKLSIIIATYNRAAVLRQTLEVMCGLDRKGLEAEFILVDNNSRDHTAEVIDAFQDRLPARHLWQPIQGKSAALNLALDTVDLGEIVGFTDDDVVPRADWLRQIVKSCEAYPKYNAFGGCVDLIWPEQLQIPDWARDNGVIRGAVFGEHNEGNDPKPYLSYRHPCGGNCWLRKTIIDKNTRFSTHLGPEASAPMGEEGEFFLALARKGHPSFYVPSVRVSHRADPQYFKPRFMLQRISRLGKGFVILRGFPDARGFRDSPFLWRARRCGSLARYALVRIRALFIRNKNTRIQKVMESVLWFSYHREALRLSGRQEPPA